MFTPDIPSLQILEGKLKCLLVRMQGIAGGGGPTTPTLVGPKILLSWSNALYFQNYGRTNNYQIEFLFKWSDQSCTPSAAPAGQFISVPLCSGQSELTSICLFVKFNDQLDA